MYEARRFSCPLAVEILEQQASPRLSSGVLLVYVHALRQRVLQRSTTINVSYSPAPTSVELTHRRTFRVFCVTLCNLLTQIGSGAHLHTGGYAKERCGCSV